MTTIAELQINLDSRPISQATKELNDFATAADKANKAAKANSQTNDAAAGSASKQAKAEADLSAMIDAQTRKLEQLGQQRRALDSSNIKSNQPAEYERLNRIIDANIALVQRQGNATDVLRGKQERDSARAEQQANLKLRTEERLSAAADRREAVVSRAAAREQRIIEQTISGLSRQIAAQTEYNRTIEQLNRARATPTSGSNAGAISNGEYESYVRLAQARRDAALATSDNSRELAAAQSRLDTYTATLGRAERAEVQYGRAVRVLDDNLSKGNITLDQYNTQLSRFANQRDAAIRSANDNSAAEARLARELNQVLTAYDPILRAQQSYNASVAVLATGLQSGTVSVEQFNRALTQQREALDGVKTQQSGVGNLGAEYDRALNSLVPYRTELRNLANAERVLQQQKDAGKVQSPSQIAEYERATAAIAAQRREIERRTAASNANTISAKQEAAALRGVPAQITDIVVSLQGGQAPFTVLLQQGGQLKDMFGGIVPAARALGGALIGLVTPATVVGGALALLAAGAYAGSNELHAFNDAVVLSAGSSGTSASQFSLFREQLDRTAGTAGKAAEALTLIQSSSKIAGDQFIVVAEAALLLERATGQALSKTVDDFAALGKEPVTAAIRLDEQYKFLTASVLSQADALVRSGREQEATVLLQDKLAEATKTAAVTIVEQAGYAEKAWRGVRDTVMEAWDAIKSIGRADTTGDRLIGLEKQREELQKIIDLNTKVTLGTNIGLGDTRERLADIDKQIAQLRDRVKYEQLAAENAAESERVRRESVTATADANRRYTNSLDGVAKAEETLRQVRLENERQAKAGNVTAQQAVINAANEANAVKKLAEAKEKENKPNRSAIDSRDVTEVRTGLNEITAEYEGYYKRVTALGEAGLVSQEATSASQRAILEQQKKATISSYDDQIDAIKKLQAVKGNSNAQNISLDNQLTRAESARVVALEKIDTRLDQLQAKEKGRVQERERNVAAYKASLDQQLENLQTEGARAADGVGRGSRQAGVAQALGQQDRNFARQQQRLANALAAGGDPTEYAENLKNLEDTHNALTAQIIKNDADIQDANYNWVNGFTAAVENAKDVGMDFAGSMERALTGTFNSAGDALATFVTTGKLNFQDFTLSVLNDLAKIAARQAASSALSGILGIAASAAGAYFGGGANGLAAGSAGATSSSLGASQAGYSSTYFQAKGGAWSGGTQMFAQGGTFTNSVVSQPTAFGMANGAKGIMGEAGDEAIVPLARTRNGDLGIRAIGGGGGSGGTIVQVNVQVDGSGSKAQTDGGAQYQQFGNDLGTFVNQRIYTIINTETRPGGSLQPQR